MRSADFDGISFLQKLHKENSWGKDVPVIFLTNVSPHTDCIIARIAEDEPAYYWVKSDFVLADVVAKVRERLDREGAHRSRVVAGDLSFSVRPNKVLYPHTYF